MHALYTAILVVFSFQFSQMQVVRRPKVMAALPMCLLISELSDRLLLMVDPSYVNWCTTSSLVVIDTYCWWSVHILTQNIGLFLG